MYGQALSVKGSILGHENKDVADTCYNLALLLRKVSHLASQRSIMMAVERGERSGVSRLVADCEERVACRASGTRKRRRCSGTAATCTALSSAPHIRRPSTPRASSRSPISIARACASSEHSAACEPAR